MCETAVENKDLDYPDECYIDVIGNDNLIHIALSWENKSLCGKPIKSKKIEKNDRLKHYSCYECTY